MDVGAKCSGCTCGEIEGLEQAITSTYETLEYNKTPPSTPEECTAKIALFNVTAKDDCTHITTNTTGSSEPEAEDGFTVDPDWGIYTPSTGENI